MAFHPVVLRTQALALLAAGIPYKRVTEVTGIPHSTLKAIRKRAKDRGFNPKVDGRILEEYVKDGDRSGRPTEISEDTKAQLIRNVTAD